MNPRHVGRVLRTVFLSTAYSLFSCFYAIPNTHAATFPIIGEINWAGSSYSSADEWLELWNNSDEPINLNGYKLLGVASTDLIFTDMHTIPPRGTFLISNYVDNDPKCAIATTTQLVTTSISLSNSNLKIQLFSPNGTLIDSIGDGSTPQAGSSLPTKTSMIRQENGDWISAATSKNLDPEITDLATPGICDACTSIAQPLQTTNTQNTSPEFSPEPIQETPTEPNIEPIIETDQTLPIIEIATTTESTLFAELPISEEEPVSESTNTSPIQPVLEPLVGTSSTEKTIEYITPSTTLELPIVTTPSITVNTTSSSTMIASSTFNTNQIDIRLHAVYPAPESGEEWIELQSPTGTSLIQATDWNIRDATGSIFKINNDDTRISIHGSIWRISLASARLNNSGDTVELVRPNGSIAERMVYPETSRGITWRKNSDQTAWIQDPAIIIKSPPMIQPALEDLSLPKTPTIELPFIIDEQIDQQKNVISAAEAIDQKQPIKKIQPRKKSESKITKNIQTQQTKPQKTKLKGKDKTKNKGTATPPIITHDMLTKLEPEIRISIEGIVGTIPGILSKNQFTIHTPDGRGLRVRNNNKQPSPTFGKRIQITGTLSLNDDGLILRMQPKDTWTEATTTESISTRIIDLTAPSQEDAWSLIQVTGTVLEVKGRKVYLELDGIPLAVNIRPVINYRTNRLSKGDLLRVTGIIDTRDEEQILLPRTANEIEILKHAKQLAKNDQPVEWPAWTPFGAAGVTVAISEGYKRLKRIAKERKLKKLAALAQ